MIVENGKRPHIKMHWLFQIPIAFASYHLQHRHRWHLLVLFTFHYLKPEEICIDAINRVRLQSTRTNLIKAKIDALASVR